MKQIKAIDYIKLDHHLLITATVSGQKKTKKTKLNLDVMALVFVDEGQA